MKSLFQVSLASLFFFSLVLISCSKESYDVTEPPVDLPIAIDTIVVDAPIALSVPGNESASIYDGEARWGTNSVTGIEFYVLTSKSVSVECPGGMSTTYTGGEDYFNFQFVKSSNGETGVFLAKFRTIINGEQKDLDNLVPSECAADRIVIDYEIVGDRIQGTFSGEFFIFNPVADVPLCDNFVSVGIVDVSFDLPIVSKCFEV